MLPVGLALSSLATILALFGRSYVFQFYQGSFSYGINNKIGLGTHNKIFK